MTSAPSVAKRRPRSAAMAGSLMPSSENDSGEAFTIAIRYVRAPHKKVLPLIVSEAAVVITRCYIRIARLRRGLSHQAVFNGLCFNRYGLRSNARGPGIRRHPNLPETPAGPDGRGPRCR